MHSCRLLIRQCTKQGRKFSIKSSLNQNAATITTAKDTSGQWQSANPVEIPQPDVADKTFSPKIEQLVASISNLSLLEVSELSQALKKRLNLPDAPMFPMGAMPGLGAPQATEEEEGSSKAVQTSFTVKLMKFDEKQKVALIKEIKSLMEGMNLVQAKKFVESAPTVVKADIGKDEAEKLKEAIMKVGGEAVIE